MICINIGDVLVLCFGKCFVDGDLVVDVFLFGCGMCVDCCMGCEVGGCGGYGRFFVWWVEGV